jgi:hypothetical protein
MTLVCVVATGQSLTSQQVDRVRQFHEEGRCQAVAISDNYKLMPWAEALVSHDRTWWNQHSEAYRFAGRKFTGCQMPGLEYLTITQRYPSGCNSGLQGMRVAQDYLAATHIVLLGFDMHGTHYFGPHPKPLANTAPARFKHHIAQFRTWTGCKVTNCTPGSALTQFPMASLDEVLRS